MIDEIRARLAAATRAHPTPWREGRGAWVEASNGKMVADSSFVYEPITVFFCAAPTDLTYLLAEIDRLEDERALLRRRAMEAEAKVARLQKIAVE